MNPEEAKKRQQNPGERIVHGSGDVNFVCPSIHPWNQEKIHEPADADEPKGEEPECAGERLAVVEPVRPSEAEDPKQIANQNIVGSWARDRGRGGG